jgi:hypothetical protein
LTAQSDQKDAIRPGNGIDNFGEIAMRTYGVSAPSRGAISEVELDRLLDAVKKAIEATPQDLLSGRPIFNQQPEHTNDNGLEWPLLPFPEGWDGDY